MKNAVSVNPLEPRHDFCAKLKGPKLLSAAKSYVEWGRAVLSAKARGIPEPSFPFDFVPPAIQLDLTTICNSECPACIDREILNRIETHNYEELLETLQYMVDRGLGAVILIGGGEPTIHPKFRETVIFLKEQGVEVAVVTNGLYVKPVVDIADRFTPPDWMRISLDAGSDPTFQALRKPRRRITLEEVCAGVPRIRERNPALPIAFSFVVSWPGAKDIEGQPVRENIHEMVAAAGLARKWGFRYISFKAYLTRDMTTGSEVIDPQTIENFEATLGLIRENIARAKELETREFEVSVSKNLRAMLDGTWRNLMNQPRRCHKQAFQWVVTPLGTFNCPAYRGVGKARIAGRAPWSVGRENKTRQALVQILDGFNASVECASTVCLYNDLNWLMQDVIEGRAELPSEAIPEMDCFL